MKSYAFKFGIIVGTIGIIGCDPNKTEINFSGSKSSANTSSALQKSSGSGATALGVRSAGDVVGESTETGVAKSTETAAVESKDKVVAKSAENGGLDSAIIDEVKKLYPEEAKRLISDIADSTRDLNEAVGKMKALYDLSKKNAEGLTTYINEYKNGAKLYERMKNLSLKLPKDMQITVDVYYYKNGIDGEKDWLPGKEIVYNTDNDRFLIKGARKYDDGSDKPIMYSLGNFDIYPNNDKEDVYNFRNIKVVKEDLTTYINKYKNGAKLYERMKNLSLELPKDMTFTVDVYYYKNGKDGEMDWLTGNEFKYYKGIDRFIMKGAGKDPDNSYKPIRYNAKEFDTYPNNNGKTKYNFRNIKVVKKESSDSNVFKFKFSYRNPKTNGIETNNNFEFELTPTLLCKLKRNNIISMVDPLYIKYGSPEFYLYPNRQYTYSPSEFQELVDVHGSTLSVEISKEDMLFFKDDKHVTTINCLKTVTSEDWDRAQEYRKKIGKDPFDKLVIEHNNKLFEKLRQSMTIDELHSSMLEKKASIKAYKIPDDKDYTEKGLDKMTPYELVAIDEGDKKFKLEDEYFTYDDIKKHMKSFEYVYMVNPYLFNYVWQIQTSLDRGMYETYYNVEALYEAIENNTEVKFILSSYNQPITVKEGDFYDGEEKIGSKYDIHERWLIMALR